MEQIRKADFSSRSCLNFVFRQDKNSGICGFKKIKKSVPECELAWGINKSTKKQEDKKEEKVKGHEY